MAGTKRCQGSFQSIEWRPLRLSLSLDELSHFCMRSPTRQRPKSDRLMSIAPALLLLSFLVRWR
jgi:hypothetical protein